MGPQRVDSCHNRKKGPIRTGHSSVVVCRNAHPLMQPAPAITWARLDFIRRREVLLASAPRQAALGRCRVARAHLLVRHCSSQHDELHGFAALPWRRPHIVSVHVSVHTVVLETDSASDLFTEVGARDTERSRTRSPPCRFMSCNANSITALARRWDANPRGTDLAGAISRKTGRCYILRFLRSATSRTTQDRRVVPHGATCRLQRNTERTTGNPPRSVLFGHRSHVSRGTVRAFQGCRKRFETWRDFAYADESLMTRHMKEETSESMCGRNFFCVVGGA